AEKVSHAACATERQHERQESQELLRSIDLPGEQLVMSPGRISAESCQYDSAPVLAAGIGDPHDQEGRDIDHLKVWECQVDRRLQARSVTWAGQQLDRRCDRLGEAGGIVRCYVHCVQLAAAPGCCSECQ